PRTGRIRPGPTGSGAEPSTRPAVQLFGSANTVRPLLFACTWQAHRTTPGVFHAGCHGPGSARTKPRRTRYRVLRNSVALRFHELHANAVQFGYASFAIVVVLSDHRLR